MSVHNQLPKKTVAFLRQIGLSTDQISAYLFLLENGPQTVLTLSRGLGTGRTKLYPLMNELVARQLVAVHERHYGTSYEARGPESIGFLIDEQESQARSSRESLPAALFQLEQLRQQSPSASKIVEYHDIDGLKQIRWNLNTADREIRQFELAGLSKKSGKHFTDKLQTSLAEKGIKVLSLTNRKNSDKTLSPEEDGSSSRSMKRGVYTIEYETYIYNNVTALLAIDNNKLYGVEIYNEKLACQQKQIFDLLWKQAS